MSTASKGRAFEHQIRDLFRRAGFSVLRGAGSKGKFLGGCVDLVASKVARRNKYRVELGIVTAQCKVRGKA